MNPAPASLEEPLFQPDDDLESCRAAGALLARATPAIAVRRRDYPRRPKLGHARRILARAVASRDKARAWLLDNARLIRAVEKDVLDFVHSVRELPMAIDRAGAVRPRVCLLARAYMNHVERRLEERSCTAFLEGYQRIGTLSMAEIWEFKSALELELLDRLAVASPAQWPDLVASLRLLSEAIWKDVFEAVSVVDRTLRSDPAGAYAGMDFASREYYRRRIKQLADHSRAADHEVALAAIELAQHAQAASDGSRAARRRTHVGYYLVDRGLSQLQARIDYHAPLRQRIANLALRYPDAFYLTGIELLTFFLAVAMLSGLNALTPVVAAFVLLLLPATQAAVDFINSTVMYLLPPRVLPKLDFSCGVPADCSTMVAVPTLLLNEAQVRDLTLDLEIRFLANRDPNIYFALLTDTPDSKQPVDERDGLIEVCRQLIEGLNRRYAGSPFFLFHRHRMYNDSEGCWMGWERKRGKLLDLNRLLRDGHDVFPVKVGDLSVLPRIRYVLTVDSDTQLPRESAARLIGAIAHPLNAAVVDPSSGIVTEGYGIVQPRIGISVQSASRSRLAALYSGETGLDIYTRAVSDVYQDLFGEGIFTGKGIYEVDALRDVLDNTFPENALLSHDLIEGAYARVALASDIELIDDYPSQFSAYSRRKHRWVRGDWQILRWSLPRVPDARRRLIPNPISLISRWKIVDNLRRSLLEPALVALLLGGWLFLPGGAEYWTYAAIAMLFLPVYCALLFALLRFPLKRRALRAWLHNTLDGFVNGHAVTLLSLIFLLHQALVAVDAIVRSILRVFVTRRKLLEWETAAEAEAAARRKATVDVYLEWTPLFVAGLGLLVWQVRPSALPIAAPVLLLWVISGLVSGWLNRPPRTLNRELSTADARWLQDHGERIYRFFRDWSSPATNWLVPDSVREDGEVAARLSPTNLGMLLNARIAALELGATTLGEFVFETRQTLDRVLALPKHRGHLLNWYDISSLVPLQPRFVSTVDSGNLAGSLWTLKQAARAFADGPPRRYDLTPELAAELAEIANICDRLVREMDFRFLYNRRRKALSIGYDLAAAKTEPGSYDLLASESRLATFIAIAKGDIPQEAWFHLGRGHAIFRGECILLSWTGTMFEYLMPAIWMRHYPGTIMESSLRAVVRGQREYARGKGIPWGISESAWCGEEGGGYGYAPFGIPELALQRRDVDALVVAPYAAFLALAVDPAAALKNLRRMEEYGWSGRYGLYEAADYTHKGAELVRSWMAHHQGMSLLSICNLLFDNPMQRYFHAEPQVLATELLLHERLPVGIEAETAAEPALPPLAAEA